MKPFLLIIALATFLFSCSNQSVEIENGTFLKGDMEHFVETLEEQLGGFSETMREVAYRYEELYWAGLDGNWAYADYQLEHIEEAIEAGIIRRPARALNAELFLMADQKKMQYVIDNEDAESFEMAFQAYRAACVACHEREEVSFIPVGLPQVRRGITFSE